jgi:transcriptional regulator with XRE-family HTH domain
MPDDQTLKQTLEASIFVARLKELRLLAGLTQARLGEYCGVAHNHIARYEAGGRVPSWTLVCLMADALGVSVAEFRNPAATPKKERKKK